MVQRYLMRLWRPRYSSVLFLIFFAFAAVGYTVTCLFYTSDPRTAVLLSPYPPSSPAASVFNNPSANLPTSNNNRSTDQRDSNLRTAASPVSGFQDMVSVESEEDDNSRSVPNQAQGSVGLQTDKKTEGREGKKRGKGLGGGKTEGDKTEGGKTGGQGSGKTEGQGSGKGGQGSGKTEGQGGGKTEGQGGGKTEGQGGGKTEQGQGGGKTEGQGSGKTEQGQGGGKTEQGQGGGKTGQGGGKIEQGQGGGKTEGQGSGKSEQGQGGGKTEQGQGGGKTEQGQEGGKTEQGQGGGKTEGQGSGKTERQGGGKTGGQGGGKTGGHGGGKTEGRGGGKTGGQGNGKTEGQGGGKTEGQGSGKTEGQGGGKTEGQGGGKTEGQGGGKTEGQGGGKTEGQGGGKTEQGQGGGKTEGQGSRKTEGQGGGKTEQGQGGGKTEGQGSGKTEQGQGGGKTEQGQGGGKTGQGQGGGKTEQGGGKIEQGQGGGKTEGQGQGGEKTQKEKNQILQKPQKLSSPEDWPEFFQPRSQQQFSLEYPLTYKASQVCTPPVDIITVIVTSPQNHLRRQAIRDTWGSVVRTRTWPGPSPQPLPKTVGLVFLLGEEKQPSASVSEALRQESEKYGDVVQWKGLQDTYFNLTLKVLLGLKWVTQFCPQASHVVKVDDDTFVHVPRLLQHFTSPASSKYIRGWFFSAARVERGGKYAVMKNVFPFQVFPPHVKGGLYVLPGSAVSRIVATAPYLPYNNMEDVHVTGTLARAVGLGHQGFERLGILVPSATDLVSVCGQQSGCILPASDFH